MTAFAFEFEEGYSVFGVVGEGGVADLVQGPSGGVGEDVGCLTIRQAGSSGGGAQITLRWQEVGSGPALGDPPTAAAVSSLFCFKKSTNFPTNP